jgi:hypothetical protein
MLLSSAALVSACSEGKAAALSPMAPTAAVVEPPLGLASISSEPSGVGVQYNTEFQFTANGTFPSGTQFVWRFGDGSTTTTTVAAASHTFAETGVFDVSVEARSGGISVLASRQTQVRSLLGRWFGTVTGFASFPLERPTPITSFELLVANQTMEFDTPSLMLHGRWADDAGCRETRVEFMRQTVRPVPSATVTFGVNNLSCASGNFYLTGLADAGFNRVDGHCNVVGNNPNCRFSMRRE